MNTIQVLDHGYVTLRNIAGPSRRPDEPFDADDTDFANAARFSFDEADEPDRTRQKDLRLARYLLEHHHNTPIEMVVAWFEMQMPIFVARQFVRHRTVSINEVSARYTQLPEVFYVPEAKNVGIKSENNKQGRDIVEVSGLQEMLINDWLSNLQVQNRSAYSLYSSALADGIPNELARMVLPLNIYTKWLWKQDLHNLMHLLELRLDGHAQFEARAYATAIYDLLSNVLPETMKAFTELRL